MDKTLPASVDDTATDRDQAGYTRADVIARLESADRILSRHFQGGGYPTAHEVDCALGYVRQARELLTRGIG